MEKQVKMKTTITFTGLLLISLHCAGQTTINKVQFPIQKDLKCSTIEVEPVLIAKSPGLVISNNYIVFLRSKGDNIFSIFSFPSLNHIGDFGTIGKGPNEFLLPDVKNAVASNDGFILFDVSRKVFVHINISKLIENRNFVEKHIEVPRELYTLNDAHIVSDKVIWGMPYPKVEKEKVQSKYMYTSYNTISNQVEYFGVYPDIYKNRSEVELWTAFYRHSIVKPDGKRIASFFDSIKMLRIYNQSKKLIKELIMETQDYFSNSYRQEHGIKHYYKVVKSTEQYIFALCYNAPKSMFFEIMPTIEVWNWDGEPIANFKMSNSILTFDVTSDNKKIYCVDYIDTNKFYVYDIESILN